MKLGKILEKTEEGKTLLGFAGSESKSFVDFVAEQQELQAKQSEVAQHFAAIEAGVEEPDLRRGWYKALFNEPRCNRNTFVGGLKVGYSTSSSLWNEDHADEIPLRKNIPDCLRCGVRLLWEADRLSVFTLKKFVSLEIRRLSQLFLDSNLSDSAVAADICAAVQFYNNLCRMVKEFRNMPVAS